MTPHTSDNKAPGRGAYSVKTREGRNAERPGYGAVAKWLHWLVFVLLIVQLFSAWLMPHIGLNIALVPSINIHFTFGTIILVLTLARFVWRLGHRVPLLNDGIPHWQNILARATHDLLNLLLIVLPFMGWVNASAHNLSIKLFNAVELPRFPGPQSRVVHEFGELHITAAYTLLVLIGLHVLASLYHHFWMRDRVLTRMLPGG
jgi:cytochrome b561